MSAIETKSSPKRTGRGFYLAMFCAALAWSVSSRLLSASSATGITNRLNADWATEIVGAFFFLFLLAVGFSLLGIIAREPVSARAALGLPSRATAGREWLLGVAIGWGMITLTVLPMALAGDLHLSLWFEPRAFAALLLTLVALALISLSIEVVYRGYAYQRLIDAVGPVAATIVMALIYAIARVFESGASGAAFFLAFLSAIVFSLAWLRTHGLWLSWGMRFGWMVSMGVIFGLPVSGSLNFGSIIGTDAVGRIWRTGGEYGPEASRVLLLALVAGLIALIRSTRDYAWNYTHAPIVPGGYPMEAQPPAAHAAMEQEARAKASALIQILPTTPDGRSALPPPPPPRP